MPPLHAEPIDPAAYLEKEAARLHARQRQGWGRAYARSNQVLPYGGTCLTPGEVERIRLWLEGAGAGVGAGSPQGAALVSAVMTTGRSATTLATARVVTAIDTPPTAPLLHLGTQWTWWLAPGQPRSPQLRQRSRPVQTVPRPAFLPFPVSTRTRRLLEQAGIEDRIGAHIVGNADMAACAVRDALRAAGVRASAAMVTKWLFHRLATMQDGDIALAALVTGHVPITAATVVQYTMIDGADVPIRLARALEGFDTVEDIAGVEGPLPLGSRNAPTLNDVRAIVARLTRPLCRDRRGRRSAISDTHNAITLYTALFGLFATGGRPIEPFILDPDRIDPATGFLIVDDKPTMDNFKTRLVWASDAYRRQLSLYRRHLTMLMERRPDLAGAATRSPFLLNAQGQAIPLTRHAIRAALAGPDWPYPLNAGRHFLRSALVGRLGSETLHAFLGHWHLGTEPWGAKAGLDPLTYRAELAIILPPLLADAGFVPMPGLE
ncbi:hypothetical protein ACFSC3_16855 [Sphingomonas floccifaciens]|uniref:Tyr recombinase domain-containing protein n=1 Tax=Sphingomonas floccifaciens TaxID=1844115 RepID=A0ABW4NGE6_9SPHN